MAYADNCADVVDQFLMFSAEGTGKIFVWVFFMVLHHAPPPRAHLYQRSSTRHIYKVAGNFYSISYPFTYYKLGLETGW